MGNSTDQFDLSCPDRELAYSWFNRVVTQILPKVQVVKILQTLNHNKKYAKTRN